MSSATYAEKLKDPRWQKKRLDILERDKWTCKYCGDTKTCLHIHHTLYQGTDPWDTEDAFLECICEHCHYLITTFHKIASDLIIKSIYKFVASDGNKVLAVISGEDDRDKNLIIAITLDNLIINDCIYFRGNHLKILEEILSSFKNDKKEENG